MKINEFDWMCPGGGNLMAGNEIFGGANNMTQN